MKKLFAALVVLAWLAAPLAVAAECTAPVDTGEGPVVGRTEPGGTACAWKGIPYAAPPVGELRWKAPQPAPRRGNRLEAYQFSNSCPAKESITSGGKSLGFSEDCLTLNIWRPDKSGEFPVMFWIHGGGFTQGSSAYELYNGSALAAGRDVVVVSINYRLGALGFLALPELADQDPNKSTGNWGILDQIQALKWVRDNIRNFGGDPGNVTVFGHSAGGTSVSALLVSPAAAGLFHRAINMSGPVDMVGSLPDGFKQGRQFAADAKCEGERLLECLRGKPWTALVKGGGSELLNGGVAWSPHVDGYAVSGPPLVEMKAGKWNQVPLITGTARDEADLFTIVLPGVELMPRAGINWLMDKLMGPVRTEVLRLYSYDEFKPPYKLVSAAGTDLVFTSRTYTQAEAASNAKPTWMYRTDWDETRVPSRVGAFHGIDVPMVFGSFQRDLGMLGLIASKKKITASGLSEAMMSYFANFAKSGDPNGPGVPAWPPYTTDKKERMIFDNPAPRVVPLSDADIERYSFLAGHKLGEGKK